MDKENEARQTNTNPQPQAMAEQPPPPYRQMNHPREQQVPGAQAAYPFAQPQPMAQPIPQPMTQPIPQPMTQPIPQPMTQPIAQPMQITYGSTTPYILPQPPSSPVIVETYNKCASVALGVLQTLIGVACIAINAVGFSVEMSLGEVSHGIWGGVFFIISGSLAISAGSSKRYSIISASVGMSVMSALIAIPGLGLSAAGTADDYNSYRCDYRYNPDSGRYEWMCDYFTNHAGLALNIVLVILMSSECVLALWTSILGCSGGRCCSICCSKCCGPRCCDGCCDGCCGEPTGNTQAFVISGNQVLPQGTMIPTTGHMITHNGMQTYVVANANNNNNNNNNNNGDDDDAEDDEEQGASANQLSLEASPEIEV